MRLQILPSTRDVARSAAQRIARVLRGPRETVLVLASGKTMVPVYREVVGMNRSGRAPFARARTFNLDELRVPPRDPRSFRRFMERHLFSRVDLPRESIEFLRGDATDPEAECRRFERVFSRAGTPDLVLVGIGTNGHVAYLEPRESLPPRTSLVSLSASTRRALTADSLRPAPREALTMGLETILSGREILLIACGREKAAAVAAALAGPVSPRFPASFLTLHPRLTVLLNHSAANRLARESAGKQDALRLR